MCNDESAAWDVVGWRRGTQSNGEFRRTASPVEIHQLRSNGGVLSSIRWLLEERRPLLLTVILASTILAAVYFWLRPSSPAEAARRRIEFIADCRVRYAEAKSVADSALVDVWPSPTPIEGRKIPERNDLFTCGAYRRRGEL